MLLDAPVKIGRRLLQVLPNTDGQVALIFIVETLPLLSLRFESPLQPLSDVHDGIVVQLAPVKLLDAADVGGGKLSGHLQDEAVFLQLRDEAFQLLVFDLVSIPVLVKLLLVLINMAVRFFDYLEPAQDRLLAATRVIL